MTPLANLPAALQSSRPTHGIHSATSLHGLEQAIPPETETASKTRPPPADQWKPLPLPPVSPSAMRQASHGSVSRSPYTRLARRPSSIYSDSVSAWHGSGGAWSRDATESPVPLTRTAFYEANKTSFRASMSEPQLLLPRTYQPVLASSGSPATSRTPPSPILPPAVQRPSELLPPPAQLSEQHPQTIPLETAQAIVDAPGSQHLLPEELRARRLRKSKSIEHLLQEPPSNAEKPQKPGSAFKPHESPTIRLPSLMMLDARTWQSFDPSRQKHGLDKQTMVGLPANVKLKNAAHSTQTTSSAVAYDKVALSATFHSTEEDRGRTRHRMPRPAAQPVRTTKHTASEYSALVRQPYTPDGSVGSSPIGIESSSRTGSQSSHAYPPTKPAPLFAKKLPGTASGSVYRFRHESPQSSVSPRQVVRRGLSAVPSDHGTDPQPESSPPIFELDDFDDQKDEQYRVDSTTGSIPISPPFIDSSSPADQSILIPPNLDRPSLPPSPTLPSPPAPEVIAALAQAQHDSRQSTKAKRSARESAYYPYIGRRRHGKQNTAKARPHPARAASSVARDVTPASKSSSHRSTRSSGGSDVPELVSRAAHKASHLAGRFNRRADHLRTSSKHATPGSAAHQPTSPPTLSQSVTGVYLGWSEESKEDFDASKPISPKHHYATKSFAPRPVVKPVYEHVSAPMRPLDERAASMQDHSSPAGRPRLSRSGSIFGTLFELRKEKGREKRREEIKRSIRVLPNPASGLVAEIRPVVEKSASDVELPQRQVPEREHRLAVWGRRLSEFGMI